MKRAKRTRIFNQNTGLNVWPVTLTSKYYTLELLP